MSLTTLPTPASTDDLTLTRERDRTLVNEFLEQRHPLGSVPGWKACFGARYRDFIVAVAVIGRPVARMADDGTELSITRYCRRDDRPANTGSWLIAHARRWVWYEGFDVISAHSGVAGNYGKVYSGAGFLLDCPRCRWVGHPKGLGEIVASEALIERFPMFEVGELVEICPECEDPPLTVADGQGWLTQGDDRDTWADYARRKWVCPLRGDSP